MYICYKNLNKIRIVSQLVGEGFENFKGEIT